MWVPRSFETHASLCNTLSSNKLTVKILALKRLKDINCSPDLNLILGRYFVKLLKNRYIRLFQSTFLHLTKYLAFNKQWAKKCEQLSDKNPI